MRLEQAQTGEHSSGHRTRELRLQPLAEHTHQVLRGRQHAFEERHVAAQIVVVAGLEDLLTHDPVQVGEIQHHPRLRVDPTLHGHPQLVVVAVGPRAGSEQCRVLGVGEVGAAQHVRGAESVTAGDRCGRHEEMAAARESSVSAS